MDDSLSAGGIVSEPVIRTMNAYDAIASRYAATWFDDSGITPKLDRFLAHLPSDGSVLDAGCGPGRDVRAILNRGIDAVGIDLSPGMLREAANRVPNAVFRKMSLTQLRYPPAVFAGLWACASVQHLTRPEAVLALREFARVLEPGGALFVTIEEGTGEQYDDFGRYRHLYSCDEFRKMVTDSGFSILREDQTSRDKSTLPSPRPKQWFEVIAVKERTSASWDDGSPVCSCMLCPPDRFRLNRGIGANAASSILWGDEFSYAVPDLAPLSDGHVLLTSSTHCTCYGAGSDALRTELRQKQERIRTLFDRAYSKPTVFLEHGPAKRHEAGSCIDHAHLHCIPMKATVHETVDQLVGPGLRCASSDLQQLYARRQSYLYVEEADRTAYVYPLQVAPLQFLRQIAAKLLGNPNWRWQDSYKLEETRARFQRTISKLSSLIDYAAHG